MRIGLDHYTIAHRGLSPFEALQFVKDLGLDGVQFLEPSAIARPGDAESLIQLRDRATQLGLYLEIGIPSPNPIRRSRLEKREISIGEHADWLTPQLEAAATLGARHVRAYIGDRHDRFRSDTPWPAQLAATTSVLQRICSILRSLGLKVAVETHADLTADELLRLLGDVGTDNFGVTLDSGNLLMRLDDPLEAAKRLAPFVLCTHIKDAVLARTPRGLCWQARPIGEGIVPIREIVAVLARVHPDLNLSIELHPRTYDLPTLDPTWRAFFPDWSPRAQQAIESYADRCEALYKDGSPLLPRPEAVEATPWAERELAWITRSREVLRSIVAEVSP